MISEITFSRKFTSFWNHLLPNANNYIRLVNGGLLNVLYEPLGNTERKDNIVLINEIAFKLFCRIVKNELHLSSIDKIDFYQNDNFILLVKEVEKSLLRFTYGSKFSLPFDLKELKSIRSITLEILNHFKEYPDIIIYPRFKGCGFIDHAIGDVYSGSKLIEIKSGKRYFKVIDFRQILIYCTLNYYSNDRKIINLIELFNPRMGIAFSTDIHSLCKNLAALLPEEVFSEIKSFITENDFIEGALISNLA